MTARVLAVITGGGTAGHVLPALAIAEGLVDLGHAPDELLYVGATRGIEVRLLPDTGIPHRFFDVVGFQRSFSKRNLAFVPKMLRARRSAIRLLEQVRPRVVVSVGGYASMPCVLAARRLGLPVVVVSYDRRPGRASRLAARRAAACAVAFPETDLPRAVHTGAPLRRAIRTVDRERDRAAARQRLGVPSDRFLIVVMGGSLGSGVLNAAVAELVNRSASDRRLAVRHICGERFLASMPPPMDGSQGILYDVKGFEDDMPTVYAAADLFIGRGGASTVCEVAAVGVPAVLVPWAGSAEDHQTENVRWLSDRGGAVMVTEASGREAVLAEIERLRNDESARRLLADTARECGAMHRTDAIGRLIEETARG